MERAKELLLNSDLSIAQITDTVGFANQWYLTNHFKRMLGVTPKMVDNNSNNLQNTAKIFYFTSNEAGAIAG